MRLDDIQRNIARARAAITRAQQEAAQALGSLDSISLTSEGEVDHFADAARHASRAQLEMHEAARLVGEMREVARLVGGSGE